MSVMLGTFQDNIGGQTVDMSNALHTLTIASTTAAGQTQLISRLLFVDPNGGANNLDLPAVANLQGEFTVVNTADAAENITVRDSLAATVVVVGENEIGKFYSDGTSLFGGRVVA